MTKVIDEVKLGLVILLIPAIHLFALTRDTLRLRYPGITSRL